MIGIKVSLSPSLPSISTSIPNNQEPTDSDGDDAKLREVNVEFMGSLEGGGDFGKIAAKTVINVFDQSLKEVRMALVRKGHLLHPDMKGGSSDSSREDGGSKGWRSWTFWFNE